MVKVAGIWDLGWNTPIMEFDLWAFLLRDFEVDEFCMTPISGIAKPLVERRSIEEYVEENRHLPIVAVDENGETPLAEFEHPTDVLYILGRASRSVLSLGTQSVHVETPSGAQGLLWPHQALGIVLYDRQVKQWR